MFIERFDGAFWSGRSLNLEVGVGSSKRFWDILGSFMISRITLEYGDWLYAYELIGYFFIRDVIIRLESAYKRTSRRRVP